MGGELVTDQRRSWVSALRPTRKEPAGQTGCWSVALSGSRVHESPLKTSKLYLTNVRITEQLVRKHLVTVYQDTTVSKNTHWKLASLDLKPGSITWHL